MSWYGSSQYEFNGRSTRELDFTKPTSRPDARLTFTNPEEGQLRDRLEVPFLSYLLVGFNGTRLILCQD